MTRLAALAAAALFALPLAAPAQQPAAHGAAHAEHAHDEHADHVSTAGDLRLVHAWTRATEGRDALVFVEIENNGAAAATLTGGESAVAESVEVVGFQLGAGGYVPLGELPIAPGSVMKLGPEGVALRLNGLNRPLRQGETFAMEIAFGGAHVDVTVEIEAADARQHGHAGHKH